MFFLRGGREVESPTWPDQKDFNYEYKTGKNMRKFIYEENTTDLRFLNLFQFSYEEKTSKICGKIHLRGKNDRFTPS